MALTKPFAENGNKTTIPATTSDGSVSYDQGFGSFYALPPEEGGLFIDRAQFNQLMYDTTSAVISNQDEITQINNKISNLESEADDIVATKAGFVTATLAIGENEKIKNFNEFLQFATKNFANYYIISLNSNIENNEKLNFRGINFGINTSAYNVTFNKEVYFDACEVYFGGISFTIGNQVTGVPFSFNNSKLYWNGNSTIVDNSVGSFATFGLLNSEFYIGAGDSWDINISNHDFIGLTGGRVILSSMRFNGSLPSNKYLIKFVRQGTLMTNSSNFNNLSVSDIAQNQLTNKGLWFNF